MVILLHIDTSADQGQIILSKEGEVLSTTQLVNQRTQAADINLCIEEILSASNLNYKSLSGIVICGGPGSYTGLRVGMSTAKGLCYALDIPLLVHNRLTLMALPCLYADKKEYLYSFSILKAREQEYFICSYYDSFQYDRHPELVSGEQVDNILATLTNKTLIVRQLNDHNPQWSSNSLLVFEDFTAIDPVFWSKYSLEKYKNTDFAVLNEVEPIYLKQVYINK
jgi:tRNA threonylcarbamoyladenosine biosynthesis protein TsaB